MDELLKMLIYPAGLLLLGKWVDYKLAKQKEEQEAIYRHQVEEQAKKQQREAERDLKMEKMQDGILAVLRDRILQSCNYFVAQGKISQLALENITMMHDAYKTLGGNGLCDRQFKAVNKLRVETFYQQEGDGK
jgi:hypothetical protein